MAPYTDPKELSRNHCGSRNGNIPSDDSSIEQRMCLIRHRLRRAVDHQRTNNSSCIDWSRTVNSSNVSASRKPPLLQSLKRKDSHIVYRPCHVEAFICDNVLLSGDRRDQFGYQELTVGGTNCAAELSFASEYASLLAEDSLQRYREFVEMKPCSDDYQSAMHATESAHDIGSSLGAISIGAHSRFNNSSSSSSYHLGTTTSGLDLHPTVESNVLHMDVNCHIGPMASSWVSLDRCGAGSNRIRSQARDSTGRRNSARGGKRLSSSSSNPSSSSTVVSKKSNVRKNLSASASSNSHNEKERHASSARSLSEAEEKRKARLADYAELFGDDSDEDEDELHLDEEPKRDDDNDGDGDIKLEQKKSEETQQDSGKKQRGRKRLKRVKDLRSAETKKRKPLPPSSPQRSKQRNRKNETEEQPMAQKREDGDDATPPAVKEKSRERLFQYLHSFMVDWGKTEGLSIKKKLLGKMYSSMIKQETSSEQSSSSVASGPSVQSITAEPIPTAPEGSDLSQTAAKAASNTNENHSPSSDQQQQQQYHQHPQHHIQNHLHPVDHHPGYVPIQHETPLHPVHQLPMKRHNDMGRTAIDSPRVMQPSHPFDPQLPHSQIGAPPFQHVPLPSPPQLDAKTPPALISSARDTSDIVTTKPHAMRSADGLDSVSHTSSQESSSASPVPLRTPAKMEPVESKTACTGKDGAVSDKETGKVNGEVKTKPRRLRKLGASKSSTSGSLSGFMKIPKKKKKVEKVDVVLESPPSPAASESSSHPEFQSPVSAASASGVPGWPSMPEEPTYAKLPFPQYQQQQQQQHRQQQHQQYPLHTAMGGQQPPPFMHSQPPGYGMEMQVKHGIPQQQQQQQRQQQYPHPPTPLSRIMSSSERISTERH